MAKKIPLGSPLQLTEEDFQELSQIADYDLVVANIAWVQEVPRWAKNLLLTGQPEREEQQP